ncbi:MAG: DUF4055 domain-containing protein [Gemmatimonas sp.]
MKLQTKDPTKPNFACAEYMAAVPGMDVMDHVLGGTPSMRKHASKYIVKWPGEDATLYRKRCECEEFFEATKHIKTRTVGMLFAKPITVTWNGAETALKETIWPNIDQRGTAASVLIKRYTDLALQYGLAVMLTDHAPRPKGVVVHKGNADRLGLRPRVAIYSRRQVPSWRVDTINNQTTLVQMTLFESARVESEGFGVAHEQRFRDLRLIVDPTTESGYLATWTLYLLVENKGKPDTFETLGKGTFKNKSGKQAEFLPVSVAYTGDTTETMVAEIPLLGVAYQNIGYHRKATDIEYYEELCAFPQRVVEGELVTDDDDDAGELPSGPGHALQIEKGGKVYWDELKGSSLEQLKKTLHQKLVNLGHMGNGFLTPDRKAQVTAEENRLTAVAEQANIATTGQGVQDSVNLSVEHLCWYLDIEKQKAATIAINMDFERKKLTSQEMDSYLKKVQANVITREQYLQAMIEGDRLPRDTNVEDTIRKLDEYAPKLLPDDDADGGLNSPYREDLPRAA